MTVVTGILNLWMHEPADTAAAHRAFVAEHGRRFLVGIGVSYAPIDAVNAEAGHYRRPLAVPRPTSTSSMPRPPPLPAEHRVLAALGPKMLELARERASGSHPYLVTPEHTAIVRDALGADRLVAPEQAVGCSRRIRSADVSSPVRTSPGTWDCRTTRTTGSASASPTRTRPTAAAIDWWTPWSPGATRTRSLLGVQGHRDAGVDHVCIQVLTDDLMSPSRYEWRRLAPALLG